MVDLNRSIRMRKPDGYSKNICEGIKGKWVNKLTDQELKELVVLMARVGESSYRRGVQQGATFQQRGVLVEDLHDWRYNNCIDFSPPPDGGKLFPDMPYAIDRLFCEEYFHGLHRIGIHKPD